MLNWNKFYESNELNDIFNYLDIKINKEEAVDYKWMDPL